MAWQVWVLTDCLCLFAGPARLFRSTYLWVRGSSWQVCSHQLDGTWRPSIILHIPSLNHVYRVTSWSYVLATRYYTTSNHWLHKIFEFVAKISYSENGYRILLFPLMQNQVNNCIGCRGKCFKIWENYEKVLMFFMNTEGGKYKLVLYKLKAWCTNDEHIMNILHLW